MIPPPPPLLVGHNPDGHAWAVSTRRCSQLSSRVYGNLMAGTDGSTTL